jgi:carbamoyltransferase
MSDLILGVSTAHDSSVCLFANGKIEYFMKEERLTRKKRDQYPLHAAISAKTNNKEILCAISSPTKNDSWIAQTLANSIDKFHNVKSYYDYSETHHLVHANLAFYNSGFKESLVFVIDRNGSVINDHMREAETIFIASYPNIFTTLYKNFWVANTSNNDNVFILKHLKKFFPEAELEAKSLNSIVKVYESATTLIKQHALENGKTMGLAAYADKKQELEKLFIEGNFPDDKLFDYFEFLGVNTLISKKNKHLFDTDMTEKNYQPYANYAWNVQKQTQESVAYLINKYVEKTGIKNICITGGYGLNVVANYYYTQQFPDVNFYFEPIADDTGNSIGAAMKLYRDSTLDKTIYKNENTFFNGVRHSLDHILGKNVTIQDIAFLLSSGKSIGVYQGLAEAGPRALGNRSILFDARDPEAKNKVNKIKKREWYRPFAGMVLKHDANKYFDMGSLTESPNMTISFPVKQEAVNVIPGVVHADNTCRIQTIDENNIHIEEMLKEFKKITQVSVILNTSFNLAGEPLVETPEDAIDVLNRSNLDYVWFPEISKIVSKNDLQ